MKSFALFSAILALGFTLATGDAEAARRLGGGKSFGMQRESVSPQKSTNVAPPAAAPHQQAAPAPGNAMGAAPAAQPKRSWLGPVAGLAAGLGLAALASHFGFGEELASMLLIGLAVMAAIALFGFLARRRSAGPQPAMAGGMRYDAAGTGTGTGTDYGRAEPVLPAGGGAAAAGSGNIPADFDVQGFVRQAKVNFLRLQAANDAGNLDDIREFTTPEMFAEIRMDFGDRGQAAQEATDVVTLEAEVLDVSEEGPRYVVSVRFHGLTREGRATATETFDEIWHLVKPRDGSRGWLLAGIQQVR